jgi:hypothetical protein
VGISDDGLTKFATMTVGMMEAVRPDTTESLAKLDELLARLYAEPESMQRRAMIRDMEALRHRLLR